MTRSSAAAILLALAAGCAATQAAAQARDEAGPIAGNGEVELVCFQGGRVVLALPRVSGLQTSVAPAGRRYVGSWMRSDWSRPEPFALDVGVDTTCMVTNADRSSFFSGSSR